MLPIWKDYYVDFTPFLQQLPYIDYRVIITQNGSETTFVGRAYPSPDGTCKVRINDICADYLGHVDFRDLETARGIVDDPNASLSFSVRHIPSDALIATDEFRNDWSYTSDNLGRSYMANAFGTFKTLPGLPAIVTFFGTSGHTTVSHAVRVAGGTDDTCGRAAVLYFWSPDCGWDVLLCKGGAKRINSYERNTMKRGYDNAQNERGTFNYQNVESVAWEVYTGRMKDQYAANMHKLVGSTDVWLWTRESGFVPVVIETNSVQALTYKNNGRKPVEYTLRVELAQDRQRR